ncbi:MAG: 30S ribosomal protein S7 [Leptospiraceae bacterium]|nr:30S ribosomal protein S7 [Leptospiraceae bacterium]MCK6380126.1 30S ribosomal protein S7 [Leptospiraceae bacterium]NUM42474.1 30S ribosomal protein S7 [Leptospiraceae bacterium]
MSRRRGKSEPREIKPDPRYNDKIVAKFINCLMYSGERNVAEKIFYDAMDTIQTKTGSNPYEVFNQALENVKPEVEVKSRRVGGATYQVPIEVRPERRLSLGIKWLIRYSRERNEKSMSSKLAGEFMEAQKGTGASIKKKEDIRKMAEANKAFSHYRW